MEVWQQRDAGAERGDANEALASAARLHMLLRLIEVRTRDELDRTFVALGTERPEAVVVMQDQMFLVNEARIAEQALAQRLPVFSGSRPLTEAGTLASDGPDQPTIARPHTCNES
jgi:hypothetical protein